MSAALSLASRQAAAVDLDLCGSGYCDRPAVAYVARYRGRVQVILGMRAAQLGLREPVELRCRECAHDELDIALDEPVLAGRGW